MVSIPNLIAANNARWKVCTVGGNRVDAFRLVAGRLIQPVAKAMYQRVEARTRVPWFVIAVIHERESSQNFKRSLAQGDPWAAKSVHVPKGRGPFQSWEEAAVDALVNCAPYAARWTDWSIGGLLTLLEQYNGLGYAMRSLPSPYVWAGTNQYHAGKYLSDGHFDPAAVDTQLGCAGMVQAMRLLDPSIDFSSPAVTTEDAARVAPAKTIPVVPQIHDAPPLVPSEVSLVSKISAFFRSL